MRDDVDAEFERPLDVRAGEGVVGDRDEAVAFRERRDAFISGLKQIGWEVPTPQATFYVWIPCPKGTTSIDLCARLLDEADVVTTPGLGFGRTADGYIRAALTVETPRLREAVERIGKLAL